MKKYEYLARTVPTSAKNMGDLITWLNKLGDVGWQVVAYDDSCYLLMREVVEPQVAQSVDA